MRSKSLSLQPTTTKSHRVSATSVEGPVCYAWVGWACEGPNYGYHAAGYHPARQRAAEAKQTS